MSPAMESNTAIEIDAASRAAWQERTAKLPEPVTITLDERGTIRDCNPSGENLFGYRRSDLIRQHVSRLFPQLSDVALVENSRINPRLRFLCRCGHHFLGQDQKGNTFFSKLNFVHLDNAEQGILKLLVQPFRNAADMGQP